MSNFALPSATLRDGLSKHQQGQVDAAESCYRDVLRWDPQNADALHLLGMLLLEKGQNNDSETLLRSAVASSSTDGTLRNSLGVCLMRQSKWTDALEELETASQFEGADHDALTNLGEVYVKLDRWRDAIHCWEKLLEASPDHDHARRSLAAVLEQIGDRDRAASHLYVLICRDVARERDVLAVANHLQQNPRADVMLRDCRSRLAVNPTHVGLNQLVGCVLASRLSLTHSAHLSLPEQRTMIESALLHLERAANHRPNYLSYDLVGRNLMELHRPVEARIWLERAVVLNPAFAPAHECLGAALLSLGEIESAGRSFLTALELYPRSPLANYELARLKKSPHNPSVDEIDKEMSLATLSRDDRILLHASLGHRYLKVKEYGLAWNHFCDSGKLKTERESRICEDIYDATPIIDSFPSVADRHDESDSRSLGYKMIFIVGMPRSGTTLLEQILACHDQVAGCGELTFISSLAAGLSKRFALKDEFPKGCTQLNGEQLRQLRNEYLDQIDLAVSTQPLQPAVGYAIDKMPTNFRFLGLIRQIFPDSKIIHIVRDPRDVAVSCMEQNLAWPFCIPSALSTYIKQYQRIMHHATAALGDDLITVRYENLVTSTKREVETVLDFLSLSWQEECLEFHKSTRVVSTPSRQQVRQPIHSNAIGKWRRYRDCNADFFDSINPISYEKDC